MTTRKKSDAIAAFLKTVIPIGAASTAPPVVTLTAASVQSDSVSYKPGYLDAVLSSAVVNPDGTLNIKLETLNSLKLRFRASGCCGH